MENRITLGDLNPMELKQHFYNQLSIIKARFSNMVCQCGFYAFEDPICEFCSFRDRTLSIFDQCLAELGGQTDWRSKFERNFLISGIQFENLRDLQRASVHYTIGLSDVMKHRDNVISTNFRETYELALDQIEEFLDSFEKLPTTMSNLSL